MADIRSKHGWWIRWRPCDVESQALGDCRREQAAEACRPHHWNCCIGLRVVRLHQGIWCLAGDTISGVNWSGYDGTLQSASNLQASSARASYWNYGGGLRLSVGSQWAQSVTCAAVKTLVRMMGDYIIVSAVIKHDFRVVGHALHSTGDTTWDSPISVPIPTDYSPFLIPQRTPFRTSEG